MNTIDVSWLLGAAILAVIVGGCGKSPDKPAAAAAADTASDAPLPTGTGGKVASACALLTRGELDDVVGGVGDPEPDDTKQQYDIAACEFPTDKNRVFLQRWKLEGSSAKEEASGLLLGALDPLKGKELRDSVKIEPLPGVGEDAVAVIERKDEARGVLDDIATLVARRGDQWVVLLVPELAAGDRAKAIEALTSLGKTAAGRL